MDWILFGPPGCGKGTQAELLAEKFDLFHFSTGEVLREAVAAGTELGAQAKAIMERGELVSDDLIIAMVKEKLSSEAVASKPGVLFDGFPRTIPQAEALEGALRELGRELGAVLGLAVDDSEIVERLSKRGRPDDTPETVSARLKVYRDQTAPVLEFYGKRDQLVELEGVGSIEEVNARLNQAIEERQR